MHFKSVQMELVMVELHKSVTSIISMWVTYCSLASNVFALQALNWKSAVNSMT